MRREVGVAPGEDESVRGLPGDDPPDLDHHRVASALDGLKQPTINAGLHLNEPTVSTGVPELRTAPPPEVDLVGEQRERRGRIQSNGHADANLIARRDWPVTQRGLAESFVDEHLLLPRVP